MINLKNPSDIESALNRIKSDNIVESKAAVHYIICKFQPLIHKIRLQVCPECSLDDMIQAGNLGILKAIESYNYESAFNTWAYYKIRDELQKARGIEFPIKIDRYALKKGITAEYKVLTDGQEEEQNQVEYNNPLQIIQKQEKHDQLLIAIARLNRRFPAKECKIFSNYYYLEIPIKKLNKRYGINCEAIIQKIIKQIRKEVLQETLL